ncbi:MAG: N-acetyl-gamma-glutamyl-phosphate reductase [Aquincola sp.]|nr:N-acetyl-gamma-glutamyl-phosphate reductase [Aquincola sp.]MDH5329928.1 N-acetyl-gamma-glutamyl-phosphate reductase [Aquincola sp.]
MNRHLVFVDGQEGTTGLRIHEYLAARKDIELLTIDAERRKDAAERARLLNAADVAFLCLPDAAAREAVALVTNPKTCVIDASTAHRVAAGWAFGIPELAPGQREAVRRAKRIANPGCHSTAFIALLRPLVDAGIVARDLPVSATSITGFSGGGKKMIEEYRNAGRSAQLDAPRPYGLKLAHKHVPEMMAYTGLTVKPVFMPIVGPFYKGLAVSVPLHFAQLKPGTDGAALVRAYERHYEGERFIRVMPLSDPAIAEPSFFDVQGANDTNRIDIFVFADADQSVVIAREDNLGKGASGAAVQCMNLHLGCDEAAGL